MTRSTSERILVYTGQTTLRPIAAFSLTELSDGECEVLKSSVQRHLDILHESVGLGPFKVELGPSLSTDQSHFIVLKSEWTTNMREIEAHRGNSNERSKMEMALIHDIAKGHAETIRSLRELADPSALTSEALAEPEIGEEEDDWDEWDEEDDEQTIQVVDEDAGDRVVIFDKSDTEEWSPSTKHDRLNDAHEHDEWIYDDYLHRLPSGLFVRLRYRFDRSEQELQDVRLKRISHSEAAQWFVLGGYRPPKEIAHLVSKHYFQEDLTLVDAERPGDLRDLAAMKTPGAIESVRQEPTENLRKLYQDPDNYWRNVWLYQLKETGQTNSAILGALSRKAADFAPLESGNALRNAVESIAHYHRWPLVKGKPGRRRSH